MTQISLAGATYELHIETILDTLVYCDNKANQNRS